MRSQLEQKALQFFGGGPATAFELSAELEIAHSTAQGIACRLKAEGLLAVAQIRHRGVGGGSGRSVYVYSLVEQPRPAA